MRSSVKLLLYFEKANGHYFYDVDVNEFLDYKLAWGPLIAGSNHPMINSAVSEQMTKSYTLGAQHRFEIQLAEK
jgi:glutamate-1-semialdehyde 2,1-aminomutase